MRNLSYLSAIIGVLALTCTLLVGLALRIGAGMPSSELAFVAVHDGRYDLMLLDANRRAIAPLTRSGFPKEPPVWSPDGTWLAFNARGSSSGLYVIDADGRHSRRVAASIAGQSPVWSPDGSQLAYVALRGGGFYLDLLDVDSGHVFTVHEQGGSIAAPVWSPDGAWIAFTVPRGGLYVVPRSGGALRMLTDGTARSPSWSPDGRSLAYSVEVDGLPSLVVVRPDCLAANVRCLDLPRRQTAYSALDAAPSWSPDSSRLAYYGFQGCGGLSLMVMTVKDGTLRRLSGCDLVIDYAFFAPAIWSADGHALVVMSPDGTRTNLFALSADDGARQRLTSLPDFGGSALYPAWRPSSVTAKR